MRTYTIGEIAERSGFSTSALRYYEQHGLLHPIDRTEAGYRIYDDRSLARLRFIDRAKQLGCTLDEVSDLAELWEREECGPVQARLHDLVSAKLADARRRHLELIHLTAQLQTAAAHLGGEPMDGPCGDDCACLGAPVDDEPVPVVVGDRIDPPVACTLPAAEAPGRVLAWQRLGAFVTDRRPLPDQTGVRLTLDAGAPLSDLIDLVVAERSCCSFLAFAVIVDDQGVALEIRAPEAARETVTAMFGAAS